MLNAAVSFQRFVRPRRTTHVLSVANSIFWMQNLRDAQLRWVQNYSIVEAIGQRWQVNRPGETNTFPSSSKRVELCN